MAISPGGGVNVPSVPSPVPGQFPVETYEKNHGSYCSQLLCFRLLRQCDWADFKSSERSGNTGNSRNHALYQSIALFPVEGRSGNSGNKGRELKNRRSQTNLGRVKSEPKGSGPRARQAVSPGFRAVACAALRLRFVVSLRFHDGRFPSAGQLLPPNLAGQAGVALRNSQCNQERKNSNYESQSNHSLRLYRPRRKNLSNTERPQYQPTLDCNNQTRQRRQ
jgi:hypothetical protein